MTDLCIIELFYNMLIVTFYYYYCLGTMGVSCFICDSKLFGERTRVCSSITPRSNVPYPEKIAELMGDEFVIIVTPADHMCKKCTSLLTHMDKLESDLKLVKTAMLSYIQKKYGILPADQPVKTLDVSIVMLFLIINSIFS